MQSDHRGCGQELRHCSWPVCCPCGFGMPWSPEGLTLSTSSADQCHQFRDTGFLQREMLREKSVASSPRWHFVLCWTVPEQSGCIHSSKTNTARQSYSTGTQWCRHCQHRAAWTLHPALCLYCEQGYNVKMVFLNYSGFHFVNFNFEALRSPLDFLWVSPKMHPSCVFY